MYGGTKTSRYIIWTRRPPQEIILITDCLCKADHSLLRDKKKKQKPKKTIAYWELTVHREEVYMVMWEVFPP